MAAAMMILPRDTGLPGDEALLRAKVTEDIFAKWGFDKLVKLY